MVVSRLGGVAVPIDSSAMRPDTESLVRIQSLLKASIERSINKIQAPVSWEFDVYHFFDLLIYSVYTSDLLVPSHTWPFLVQLNTGGVFHDDVLAPNGVLSIAAPVKDFRYGNTGISLY